MATIKIPAAYVEDAQRAVMSEIRADSEILDGQPLIERPGSTLVLKRDTQLLEQLLHATGDVTIEAEADHISDPLLTMLEAMIRQLVGRLDRLGVYAPLPLGEMLPVLDELRWAMTQAARLNPAEVAS